MAPLVRADVQLPKSVDLSLVPGLVPDAYDQGQEGSCTANAWALASDIVRRKQGLAALQPRPSRQYLYARERILNNQLAQDTGAAVGDGATILTQFGVPSEELWPYAPEDEFLTPPPDVDVAASKHKLLSYGALSFTPEAVMEALASGSPVVFGFNVYQSFEANGEGSIAETGLMTMPGAGEVQLGGHCVCAIGYEASRGTGYTNSLWAKIMKFLGRSSTIDGDLIVQNSWGGVWGKSGRYRMPFAVYKALAFDPYRVNAVAG